MLKKLLSIVIAGCLLFSLAVTPVSAAETEGFYTYEVSNGEAIIFNVSSSISGDITVPSTLGGFPVTKIDSYAFLQCTSLNSVTIPDSVTSIDERACLSCIRDSINVSINNSNYSSQDGVLFNKDKTTLICCPGGKEGAYTIPDSVTSIGDSAFSRCTSLTSVTIPDSVTSIGADAFNECTSLASIAIPDSVTSIGSYAFSWCTGLTSIEIPDRAIFIDSGAFLGCTGLTSVAIPSGLISIGDFTFEFCYNLISVTIPKSVIEICGWAFAECFNLSDVYYGGSEEDWNKILDYGGNEELKNATIHYNYISSSTVLYGDVNADGKVNTKDNAFLARHLAGWAEYESIDKKASDVNADGKVNTKDNAVLARHLAGWTGYETLPYGTAPTPQNTTVTVKAEDFVRVYDGKIRFGSNDYIINPSTKLYINGVAENYDLNDSRLEEVLSLSQGDVILTDDDATIEGYDKISVTSYNIARVMDFYPYDSNNMLVSINCKAGLNADVSQICLSTSTITDLGIKSGDIIAFTLGDVMIYSLSGNIYGVSKIIATSDYITGKVTSADSVTCTYAVDGIYYKEVVWGSPYLMLGTTYKLLLDPFGRIYDADITDTPTANYAIVAKKYNPDITLILPNGTIKTYEAKDSAVFAAVTKTVDGSVSAAYTPVDCVVEYTLKNGMIASITYQAATSFIDTNATQKTNGEYREDVSRIGSIGIDSSTNIIDISESYRASGQAIGDYKSYRGLNVSQLVDGEKYAGVGFGKIAGTSIYSLVLLTYSYNYTAASRFAVYDTNSDDGMIEVLDEDGITVKAIKTLVNGEKKIMILSDSYVISLYQRRLFRTRGDAFFYHLDSYGNIDDINWITMDQIKTNGDVTLEQAFKGHYDESKWGTALINGTEDYRLVQGIIVDVDENSVKMINIPTTSDGAIDICNYETLTLASDALVYTYNANKDDDIEDYERAVPNGVLRASDFEDWKISKVPANPANASYGAHALGMYAWVNAANAVPAATAAAATWAANRGISDFFGIKGKYTGKYAQYALALIVDGQVVEIYEIIQ